MRLNHLQLMVGDVESAAGFLTSYFGLSAEPGSAQPDASDSRAVLSDGGGLTLILLEGQDHAYPRSFHIGFVLPGDEVETLWQRLEQDGQQPSRAEDGPPGAFYVMAPGGMMIEVLAAAGAED